MITLFFIILLSLTKAISQAPNCTADNVACLPRSSCCASGTFCNFNRGIPVCQNPELRTIIGFREISPCGSGPYLYDCITSVGINGFCCPIGTVCFNQGNENNVQCINAVGSTSAALPSTTSLSLLPVASTIPGNDIAQRFNPPQAWTSADSALGCSAGTMVHSTEVVNASISLNFTGRAILINTISSPRGGVFAVIFDSVLVWDTVDTYNAEGESCSARQFPPFADRPANLAQSENHTITLVHQGPSLLAPNGTQSSIVQFQSFAIPQFEPTVNSGGRIDCNYNVFPVLLIFIIMWFQAFI